MDFGGCFQRSNGGNSFVEKFGTGIIIWALTMASDKVLLVVGIIEGILFICK